MHVQLADLGIALLLAGFVLLAVGALMGAGRGGTRARGAAVILVGPIPIAVGNDRRLLVITLLAALALLIAFLALGVRWT